MKFLVLATLLFPSLCFGAHPLPDLTNLTLPEAITRTLMNEREIKIANLEVQVQKGEVQESAGPFDPVLDGESAYTYSGDIQSLPIGAKTNLDAFDIQTDLSAFKKTRLGTLFTFALRHAKEHNPLFPFSGVAPSSTINVSNLSFEMDQPLLRDFRYGLDTMIEQANLLELQATKFESLHFISRKVLDTIVRYWDLVAAMELLEIQEYAEARFEQVVELTKVLIKANELAESDIVQPLAELATQRIRRLAAHQNVFTSYQLLLLAMGETDDRENRDDFAFQGDAFPEVDLEGTNLFSQVDCLINRAVTSRYDIQGSIYRQKAAAALLKGAQNRELPRLDLVAGMNKSDFTLGSRADPYLSSMGLPDPQTDMRVGLRFSVPFNNDEARGLAKRRMAERYQTYYRTQQLVQETTQELRDAITQQISFILEWREAEAAVKKNTELVANETIKLEAGMSTLFVLLDFENKLTAARTRQTEIHRAYVQNIATIRFLTATLLSCEESFHNLCFTDIMTLPNCRLLYTLDEEENDGNL